LAEDAFLFLGLFFFLRPGFTEGVFVFGRGLPGPRMFSLPSVFVIAAARTSLTLLIPCRRSGEDAGPPPLGMTSQEKTKTKEREKQIPSAAAGSG
jgi:hypothetical protein